MGLLGGVGEQLNFLISLDADSAISAATKFGDTVEKETKKAETGLEKFSASARKIGAISMGAGISTALGLGVLVKDFEEAEKASNKLETSVRGMGSGIDTGAIKKLGFDLQQVSTATDDQVVAAARWGAVFGLTTDQLEELLRAAVDLSAQTGNSLDATTKALAKAAGGEGYKALTKLGLTFDETAYKADAFGTTISEATQFASGAAAQQVDTMSGQLTRLGNNWDNIKAQIGEGANEVFEPMAKAAANLSESVATANPELLKTVGHFAALGSVGATAFGGLASFAGQAVNIRDAMSGFGIKLRDAEGGFTKLGKAAAIAGGAMATLAVADVAFTLINNAESAGNLADSLNDFTKGAGDAGNSAADLANDFGQLAREQAKQLQMSDLWTGFGARIESSFDGIAVSIEDTQEALDLLDPASARAALDSLQAVTNSLEKGSDQRKTNQEFIDKNRKALTLEEEATKSAALAQRGLTEEQAAAEETLKAYNDGLKESAGAMGFLEAAMGAASAAGKGFADTAEALDSDEMVTTTLALGDALKGVGDTAKDLPKTFDPATAAVGGYNDEQTKAISSLLSWGDAAKSHTQTLIESGAKTEEVMHKTGTYRDSLNAVMRQAGLTEDQIAEYQRVMGLTDDQILTEIKLAGDAEAKFKLTFMQGQLDKLDEGAQAEILALIHDGEYQKAEARMAELARERTATVNISMKASGDRMTAQAEAYLNQDLNGNGVIGRSVMMVPAGPTATTMGVAPTAVAGPARVTINLPAGTTSAQTLSSIRRYQRLGGDMGGLFDTVSAVR